MKLKVVIRCICGGAATVIMDGASHPCSRCGAQLRAATHGDDVKPFVVFPEDAPQIIKVEWIDDNSALTEPRNDSHA